jgi:uncharacterized membrane protein YidH (DUF202 family)
MFFLAIHYINIEVFLQIKKKKPKIEHTSVILITGTVLVVLPVVWLLLLILYFGTQMDF